MSARDHILAAVRRATSVGVGTDITVSARLAAHKQNVRPARSAEDSMVISRFISEAEMAGTDVRKATGMEDIPGIIAGYMREKNMSGNLKVSADPVCEKINWAAEPMLSISFGPAEPSDQASLSVAIAGVAETGTLVMTSSPDNPSMLNYLPLLHIAIIEEERIVGGYETAWNMLREQRGGQEIDMPRMVNLITGPSRTADIEQELLMGAHGPQNHMIIVVRQE